MTVLTSSGTKTTKPRVVLFSGGSACRSVNVALCAHEVELTRIVPAWDSGGSSKVIRKSLGMLSVGDIRQALMTMAHGEERAGDVVTVCNARLLDAVDARAEFELYVDGAHPAMKTMAPGVRGVIVECLKLFRAYIGDDFDLRRGSIGNFILTGAYLAHRGDINAAITAFREICDIHGRVWPVSTRNDIQLTAVLRDGQEVAGQHRVTALDPEQARCGIAHVRLQAGSVRESGAIAANVVVIDAVRRADVIVFGPGSFFTSIVPHLLVDGIAEAIAGNRRARKFFIANILECAETTGRTLAELVDLFLRECRAAHPAGTADDAFLHYVLMNRDVLPSDGKVAGFRYLKGGNIEASQERHGFELVTENFEDMRRPGSHDGVAVASAVLSRLAT